MDKLTLLWKHTRRSMAAFGLLAAWELGWVRAASTAVRHDLEGAWLSGGLAALPSRDRCWGRRIAGDPPG